MVTTSDITALLELCAQHKQITLPTQVVRELVEQAQAQQEILEAAYRRGVADGYEFGAEESEDVDLVVAQC